MFYAETPQLQFLSFLPGQRWLVTFTRRRTFAYFFARCFGRRHACTIDTFLFSEWESRGLEGDRKKKWPFSQQGRSDGISLGFFAMCVYMCVWGKNKVNIVGEERTKVIASSRVPFSIQVSCFYWPLKEPVCLFSQSCSIYSFFSTTSTFYITIKWLTKITDTISAFHPTRPSNNNRGKSFKFSQLQQPLQCHIIALFV